ncbi:18434_t:CDS:2 [Entrophospora sp. SA101]|nr:18434_t:CDS:2 [Entrophospora sp. SA101]CAJ0849993.1 18533_t:CDS:2 [Entrophospora sp. SA101]
MTISKKPTNHSTTNISRRLTVMHRFSLYTLTIFIILILRYANSGPFLPLSCQLFGSKCPTNPSINGFVKQEFNGVKEIFKQNFINGDDIGAQITVYYDNEVVVDLQGGFADLSNGRTYNEDTLQLVFSSTKVLTGIVISRLVEQGLLDYNEKVSKYWPGFAQNNKENVTLLELITHKAGVGYIDSHQISNRDLHDLDKLSEILATKVLWLRYKEAEIDRSFKVPNSLIAIFICSAIFIIIGNAIKKDIPKPSTSDYDDCQKNAITIDQYIIPIICGGFLFVGAGCWCISYFRSGGNSRNNNIRGDVSSENRDNNDNSDNKIVSTSL